MLRVVSLVPSVTETLLRWNVEPIGVTRFCEQGNQFPTFGGTKDPHLDSIVAMSPDLVVMCDQENRKEDAEALVAAGLRVHAIHITHVIHVGPEMVRLVEALGLHRSLGEACGVSLYKASGAESARKVYEPDVPNRPTRLDQADEPDVSNRGEEPNEPNAQAVDEAAKRNAGVDGADGVTNSLRVFVPIWRKPWMTINDDSYGGSLLQACGFTNIFGAHTDRYPTVEANEIEKKSPHAVLAPSEPYPFTERQRAELETFAPVQFVDGKDLFWWGARTAEAFQRIRALHH